MAITKMDEVLEAIAAGKTNDEIRNEIDGRLSDKRIDVLRAHPLVGGAGSMKNEDKEISVTEEIEREVEKIFSTGCGAADEPPQEETQANADENGARMLKLRTVSCEFDGVVNYTANTRGVWIGAPGDNGIFVPHEELEEFLNEIAYVAGECDRLINPEKYAMRCL